MNIRKTLENIFAFAKELRRSGTSTLIKLIADKNDVWVLVPDGESGAQFGEKAVTFQDLEHMKGFKPKPILIDNYTLLKLSELSLNEMYELNLKITKRDSLIRKIRDEIALFERENKKL